jgi:hypothetical protein
VDGWQTRHGKARELSWNKPPHLPWLPLRPCPVLGPVECLGEGGALSASPTRGGGGGSLGVGGGVGEGSLNSLFGYDLAAQRPIHVR